MYTKTYTATVGIVQWLNFTFWAPRQEFLVGPSSVPFPLPLPPPFPSHPFLSSPSPHLPSP